MKNEKKRDVFEEMKWELISNLANTIDQNGGLSPLEDATKVGENYATRYATAIPGDLPVIPKDIAYVIEQAKKGDYKLGWVFNAAYLGIWRVSVGNWIRTHADDFARAWLDGYVVGEEK